jgi:hypothetical protein
MRYLASLITIFALTVSLATAAPAQKRRKRPTPAPTAVSAEKIRRDIVGKSVDTSTSDGSNKTRWTFAEDELKEIEVKESETKGFITYVVIRMRTGDRTAKLGGDLQLTYRRDGGALRLDGVDNLSFHITDLERTAASAYAPPPAVAPTRPAAPQSNRRQQFWVAASSFAVPPNYYQSFAINVPEGVPAGHVVGRFRATSGDNIQAHIMDADALENFKHRNQFLTYYSSGKVTVGNINVNLRPGQYFLVFENFYSVFSNKVVRADVMLEY